MFIIHRIHVIVIICYVPGSGAYNFTIHVDKTEIYIF